MEYSLMYPVLMRAYRLWMRFVHVLGTINSYLLLSLFYLLVIGVYALFSRILALFARSKKETYWIEKSYIEPTKEHLARPF